jgi:hypothetical protein
MEKPKYLRKSQANELLHAITAAGLDPADFEWKAIEISDSPYPNRSSYYSVDMLVYRSAETFFRFGRSRVAYSPGNERRRDEGTPRDWPQTVRYFGVWLNNIKTRAETVG